MWKHYFAKVLYACTVKKLFDVVIGDNNQAFIADASNDGLSDLSKYVDLKYQLLVYLVPKGDLRLEYVPSEEMVADLLTKNLAFPKLKALVELRGTKW